VDELSVGERLVALVHGVLAANIFDWGARACVDMYQNATIMEMYRQARTNLSRRPWRVDDLDEFAARLVGRGATPPYKRALLFVDNAGADVVLGMLPFARELLRAGCEVVLVANSLPAINDITAAELRSVVAKAAEACPVIRAARDAATAAEAASLGPGFREGNEVAD
jgi:type II pantothenate kinase